MSDAGPDRRTDVIRGGRIAWREAGEGDVVLLVHAFPFDSRMWLPQLAAVAPGFRYVAPDLRGFGGSALPPGAALTMDGAADDLAALLDHLGEERAVVCGVSMGGYVAFAFWRRHAHRTRALVLCDTRAVSDTEEAKAGRYALSERVLREGSGAVVQAMFPNMLSPETRERRPEVVDTVRGIMEDAPAAGIAAALHGLAARPDSTPTLAAITVPALVVVGADDAVTPPAEAERIAAGISGARLVRIPGAGHLSNLETPGAFNDAITSFLRSLPPA